MGINMMIYRTSIVVLHHSLERVIVNSLIEVESVGFIIYLDYLMIHNRSHQSNSVDRWIILSH